MLALAIGLAIVTSYALALWWLLRGEQAVTHAFLAGLCGLSLALRLVVTTTYPAGFNEDEPKNLACSIDALARSDLFSESCNGPPYLLSTLFAAPLVPVVGFNRWAMRSYSMVLSVLAVPAAFAVARAMTLRVAPSLFVGGLIAVLPWSIFYGRISLGGELVFHQLLLLAALARLIWANGGWREALIGAFGLCLLLWDYFAGRAMMGMPLVAAVLASGWRRRAWCLAVVPLALFGWLPHLRSGAMYASIGFSGREMDPALVGSPWEALAARVPRAVAILVRPVARDAIFSARGVAVHPWFVLALALCGALTGARRGLFLLAGFAGGMLPGVVSTGHGVSTHRVMMAYPFVALAAGCAVDLIPWRRARAAAAAAALLGAGIVGVRFYFSPQFWPRDHPTFDADRTAVVEGLPAPLPPRVFVMSQLSYFGPRETPGTSIEVITLDNWLPPSGVEALYIFPSEGGPLRPFYDALLPSRVRAFGRAFYVELEAADWSWLRRHGWTLDAHCGDTVRTLHVPALFSPDFPLTEFPCPDPVTYVWRGRWDGPDSEMLLDYTGRVRIAAGTTVIEREGWQQRVAFSLAHDREVTISLVPTTAWPSIALYEQTPAGPRVPPWERVTPVRPVALANAAGPR